MIKNVIFDIGRVLLNYYPEEYLYSKGFNKEKVDLYQELVFKNPKWKEFDRGTISFLEVRDFCKDDARVSKQDIDIIFDTFIDEVLTPIEESVAFAKDVRAKGFKTYLLSNFSREGFLYVYNKYDFLRMHDGKVISYDVGFVKPEKEIYEILIKNYNLIPEECLFIDDLNQNLIAAQEFGFKTILFTNTEDCIKQFKNFLI